jgi:glycosyltransferase involved in cell wall biosynthesis
MGCPVIISDRCGSYGETDDVRHQQNGFVYPYGSIAELAEKIKLLAQNSDLRKRFGDKSHEFAEIHQERAHRIVMNELIALSK